MTSFGLGLRLALKGSRARLMIVSLALAFAVAFLLAAMGALPARQAKIDRNMSRDTVSAALPAQADRAGLLLRWMQSYWFGEPVELREVAVVGPHPVPPGVHALPKPGEMAVSPALAAALRGPHGDLLAARLPEHVTEVIGKAGLSGPRELFAYVGVTKAQLGSYSQPVVGFGRVRAPEPAPRELRRIAWLGAVALLLPVLVLVATATRLSGAARDRRLAAIRLVGASARQAALLVAAESLLAGVLGSALGLLGFLALRGFAASLLPVPTGLYGEDLMPPGRQLVLVLVAVPVLSVLTALVAMRRVVTSPLEVRRRARVRRAGWVRFVPLLLGLGMLVLMAERADPLGGPSAFLLLGGGGLTILGLAAVTPAVARLAAVLVGNRAGLAASLATRRIAADPGAAGRVVTGTVLVVFVGSWLLAFLPLFATYNSSEDGVRAMLPGNTVSAYVSSGAADRAVTRLDAMPGVTVLTLGDVQVGLRAQQTADKDARPEDLAVSVTVASCRDLAAMFRLNLGCNGSLVYRLGDRSVDALPAVSVYAPPLEGVRLGVFSPTGVRTGSITLPPHAPVLRWPAVNGTSMLAGGWLLEPRAVPRASLADVSVDLLVRHAGGQLETERIRNVLGADSMPATLDEQRSSMNRIYLGYLRAVRIGVALALVVGCLSLLVSTVDAVRERRQGLAALVALGTPLRVLRRSVLLQMGLPMLANVGVALGAAAVASWAYLTTDQVIGGKDTVLPWASWGVIAGAALLVVVAVTALSLPFLHAAGRPEVLHTE